MNCTHVPHDHLKVGDLCSICNTKIVSFVAEPARLATRGGEGAEASPTTPVAHPSFPAAHIAANPVSPTARAAAAAPETIPSPVVSGAPIKHARNTDPDTARDAALSVADAHKRRLYDHILALIFEHGPLTDWQLSRFLTVRIGEPVIATSAGKRRGELRDMGLLYDTGFRGPTETGPKKAVRWGLTPAGEMEVAA